jgi:small subunit ribosomal protein S1
MAYRGLQLYNSPRMGTDNEEDFAAMLAEFEGVENKKKRKEPRPGDEVKGRIVSIGRDAAFVDFGGKSDGVLDLVELRDGEGKVTVQVGDEIEARVVETEGIKGGVVLRRVTGRGAPISGDVRGQLAEAHAHGLPVEGLVTGVNKGGVEVQVAGVRGFCPISQLELRHVENAASYVGQRLVFRVTRYDEASGRPDLILSRRMILEEEQSANAEATRSRLTVGAVLPGKVTAIKDYGAFVDIGGIEGMLHVSELGFQRVKHPKDVLTVGQELQVQILKLEGERISLSLKSLEADPWSEVAQKLGEGARVAGTVTRLEQFGAFVEVAPGVEGLLHISELSQKRPLKHAREAAKVGQRLDVVVLTVDANARRLSLGLAEPGDENDAPASQAPAAPQKLGTFADLLKKKK